MMGTSYKPRSNSGLQEMGLPYESEPAITWHIEDFLKRHQGKRPRIKPFCSMVEPLNHRSFEIAFLPPWQN